MERRRDNPVMDFLALTPDTRSLGRYALNGDAWVGGHRVFEPCLILKPEMLHLAPTARIDSFCKIEGGQGVTIGEFVHIASFSHLNTGGGKLVFEDHSGCGSHCCIITGSPDWSFLYISAAEPSEHRHTRHWLTRICAFALLGARVTVHPGITIGEGAVVKPGSVVTENIDPWDIVEGNPAHKVGTRRIR